MVQLMNLGHILEDSNAWKIETIKSIHKKIGFDNYVQPIDNSELEKNVIVFGKSQVGKTNFILTLLGIDMNYQNKVSKILRAGEKKGNSSTSTAILYTNSSNEYFGLSYITNINDKSNPKYYEEHETFQNDLRQIRKDVECNNQNGLILKIYIPKQYFINDINKNINIIDMPGVGSRNTKENDHIKKLLGIYYNTADLKIIVARADDIESLGKKLNFLSEYDAENWKYERHNFMVVLTYSYTLENIKKYFKRKKREISFNEYVYKQFEKTSSLVLGDNYSVEIYPIDVGESFKILYDSLNDDKDKKELVSLQQYTLNKISASILERQSDSLESVVQRLNERVNIQIRLKEENLECDKKNLIEDKEKQYNLYKNQLKRNNQLELFLHTKIQKELNMYNIILSSLKKLNFDYEHRKTNFDNILMKYVESDKISFKDKNKDFLTSFYLDYYDHPNKLKEDFCKYIKNEESDADIHEIEMKVERLIPSFMEYTYKLDIYLDCFSDLLEGYKVFIFHKKPKKEEIEKFSIIVLDDLFDCFNLEKEKIINIIEKEKVKYLAYQNQVQSSIKRNNYLINMYFSHVNELEEKIRIIEDSMKSLQKDKEAILDTLVSYTDCAKKEFLRQYNKYKKLLKNKSVSGFEKINICMIMGLMELDYNKMIESETEK